MVANPATSNYMLTTVGQGLFAPVSANGLVQGTAYPDPATRFQLRTGWLSAAETIPMWGGVGIYELIPGSPVPGPNRNLGVQVGRATGLTGAGALAGFSVFDQAYGMVNSTGSPVPTAGSYMQVMSYRLGGGARIAVACDPALAALAGSKITSQVSWDFVNQLLIPYTASAMTIASGTYVPASGLVTLTMSAPVTFSAGDAIIVSALTGTGAFASLNGTWTATSAAGTTVTYTGPTNLAATTITGGTVNLGSGAASALPVSVLEIQVGNSMTVNYNPLNNTAQWNYGGSCAIIQL